MMPKTIKTSQGDTWDMLALAYMGDERFMSELIAANPDHSEVVFFSAGVEITIPAASIDNASKDLPPWRK